MSDDQKTGNEKASDPREADRARPNIGDDAKALAEAYRVTPESLKKAFDEKDAGEKAQGQDEGQEQAGRGQKER